MGEPTLQVDKWTQKRVHDWVMTIKDDLKQHAEEMHTKPRRKRQMYRVRPQLRQLKPQHYNPDQISLGLFDRFSRTVSRTKADRCRRSMAITYLEVMGMTRDDWDKLCELVVPDPIEMQDFYDEIGRDHLQPKEVQQALTLDAIFVACWLAVRFDDDFRENFPTFRDADQNLFPVLIDLDLFKVENQIPLSLVRKVLLILVEKVEPEATSEMRVRTADQILTNLCLGAIKDIRNDMPGFDPEHQDFDEESIKRDINLVECEHLLDCLHQVICHGIRRGDGNSDRDSMRQSSRSAKTPKWWPNFCGSKLLPISCLERKVSPNDTNDEKEASCSRINLSGFFTKNGKQTEDITLPTVTQLQKAGIEFEGLRGSFHEVKFKRKGLLKRTLCLPLLALSDNTEPLWRNIVAYEDFLDQPDFLWNQDFTKYLMFMDEIIESEKDVNILKASAGNSRPVICEDGLGMDRAIAHIFNNSVLKQCIPWNDDEKYQSHRREIMNFYNQDTRRLFLEFYQTYFGKPWLTASVLAATILLVATLLQTYYAMATFYKVF